MIVSRVDPNAPRIVFLDFDGVILESNEAKAAAYRELFRDYPDQIEEIVALYRAHAGLHRAITLRQVVGEILGEVVTDERVRILRKRFAALVAVHVRGASEVDGLRNLLQAFPGRCYVVSGAPEEEVRSALEERGLAGLFVGIFGAPKMKFDVLMDVLSRTGVDAAETVYVGDSMNDYGAATSAGIPFVARVTMDHELSSSPGWPRIDSLNELLSFLACQPAGRVSRP